MGGVDFWWLKPHQQDPSQLNPGYLSFNDRGACKNDAGGAAGATFQKIASKFTAGQKQCRQGDGMFGVHVGDVPRAFFNVEGSGRCYIVHIWQEDWCTNPFKTQYTQGYIIYQKASITAKAYYVRPFRIEGEALKID